MAESFAIDRGLKCKDRITGFEGVVTGRADYITGCNQYLLQPSQNKDGAFVEGRWFDEHRLDVLADAALVLPKVKAEPVHAYGSCGQAPTK